jgi:two-component system, NtrC family, response regulator HydG
MPPESFGEDTTRRAPESLAPTRTFSLVVTEGPNAGTTLVADSSKPPRLLLGKSPACELRLDDPLVSRRHAAVDIDAASLRLTDLGSTNGTMVNGLRVIEVLLRGGETLKIGQSVIRVDVVSSAAGAKPSEPDSFGRLLGRSP